MLVSGIIAVLIACVVLIPCAYAFHVTMQSGLVRGELGYPDGILSIIKHVIAYPTYVFPALYGGPGLFDVGRILSINLFDIPFFGSVLLILAFLGLIVKNGNKQAKTIALFGLLLPITPLVGPMYQRLLMIFILGGIWLAVDVIANCSEEIYKRIIKVARIVFALVFLAVLFIGIAAAVKHDMLAEQLQKMVAPAIPLHRFGARPDWFYARIDKFIYGISIANPRIWLPLVAFGVSVWILPYRRKKCFGFVLALCVFSQLWIPHKEWMTFVYPPERDMSRIHPETEEIDAIRASLVSDERVLVVRTPGQLPLFPPNILTYFDIPSLTVYDSILPNGMLPHGNYSPTIDELNPAEFYSQIGVGLLVVLAETPISDPGWVFEKNAGKIAIYRNKTVRNRYVAIAADGTRPPTTVSAQINQRNFRAIDVPQGTVELSICENHAAGWKFRIENQPWAPLSRADDGSMSAKFAPLSAPSRVEINYDPPELKLGKAISIIGIIVYLIVVCFQLRPRAVKAS